MAAGDCGFFLPQALVVAHLNRRMPLEGGLYEWARPAFNDGVGFLVAWNLWLFATLYTAVVGLIATAFLAYALGPQWAWLETSPGVVDVPGRTGPGREPGRTL